MPAGGKWCYFYICMLGRVTKHNSPIRNDNMIVRHAINARYCLSGFTDIFQMGISHVNMIYSFSRGESDRTHSLLSLQVETRPKCLFSLLLNCVSLTATLQYEYCRVSYVACCAYVLCSFWCAFENS